MEVPLRRSFDPILVVLLGLSLCGNVYLFRRLPVVPKVASPLKVGDKVPDFRASRLEGGELILSFDQRPAILYTFSPACIWCDRNLDNARELARQARPRYDFVAVALNDTGLAEYVRDRRLDWLVVGNVPEEVRRAYRMTGTPETIVVGRRGTVLRAWSGAYTANITKQIETFFGVTLPGLQLTNGKSASEPVR